MCRLGGEAACEIRVGNVVIISVHEKHWHEATATTALSHLAIQEALEGVAVNCLESVSTEQYGNVA